ncbi:MAG: alanine racemase domain protein [Marmoricola sp.]|jgi:hypothetical protein|nr:alanine racemase domain protein [Marmoricola sp.]
MSLTLYVDGDRWRAHLRSVLEHQPLLVPVAKGNGYGFGNGRLARRAQWLGVDTIAVGTYDEVADVADRFHGDILVLTPWRPFSPVVDNPRVIHTVGRLEDLTALASSGRRSRVVLERMTSMARHGFTARGLRDAGKLVSTSSTTGRTSSTTGGVVVEGAALHLPLAKGSHLSEVERLMTDIVAAGLDKLDHPDKLDQRKGSTIWVSHLSNQELTALSARYPDFTFRPRIGTGLWLGDRDALSVKATVLDVHPVERGDVFGYRGRSAPRNGTILVVSGGTAHGIGLEAPTGEASIRARAASLARGGLDAAGFVRSPYTVGGKQRLFAEPPHMQASMLFLPSGSDVPAVGDEIDVRVRYTATDVDRVEISQPRPR